MRRTLVGVAVFVAALTVSGGFAAHVSQIPTPQPDTGISAKYDRCTYLAFINHTDPRPCWAYVPKVPR